MKLQVDANWDIDPRFMSISDGAQLLWFKCAAFVVRNVSEGVIRNIALARLSSQVKFGADLIQELLSVGLIENHGEDFKINNLKTESREKIEKKRIKGKERVKKYRSVHQI